MDALQNLCVKKGKRLLPYLTMGFGNPYGDEWSIEPIITSQNLFSVQFTDETTCYVSGGGGTILKSIDVGVTFISDERNGRINKWCLSYNYPNPFNPTTTIKYEIPELSFVTLKVYDVLGKEIATLVNEEKAAGIYELEFNAAGLPSGIYFYQLKAGSFNQIKKMALMK